MVSVRDYHGLPGVLLYAGGLVSSDKIQKLAEHVTSEAQIKTLISSLERKTF